MRIHDPHVNVKMKVGPGKVSMCLCPPFVHRAGAEENSRMGWCDVPRVSMAGGRTNNTAICSKYIISISTRGETLLWGDPLNGEM